MLYVSVSGSRLTLLNLIRSKVEKCRGPQARPACVRLVAIIAARRVRASLLVVAGTRPRRAAALTPGGACWSCHGCLETVEIAERPELLAERTSCCPSSMTYQPWTVEVHVPSEARPYAHLVAPHVRSAHFPQ